jgi:hypothetical protein
MRTKFFLLSFLAAALCMGFAACSDNDDEPTDPEKEGQTEVPEDESVPTDTIHLAFKGDSVVLEDAVTPFFASELTANPTGTFSYSIAAQPKKKEIGFGSNGEWVTVDNVYKITPDNIYVVADSILPAFWNLPEVTDKVRELKPAVLLAKLAAGGKEVTSKRIALVQDSITPEILKIEAPTVGYSSGISYAASNGVLTWVVGSNQTFSGISINGYYSDGRVSTLANKINMDTVTKVITYTYPVEIIAVNDNGSPTTEGTNKGNPISQNGTTPYSYHINRPTSVPTNVVGENGYFDIYPYGTSKDDWRAVHLVVKPVAFTGIIPRPDDNYIEYSGAGARRFRTGVQGGVQANFYAFEKVSEGPIRPYLAGDNGGNHLLVIPDSWNDYNGSPIIEANLAGATARNNSLLKPGAATSSTTPADYFGFQLVQLTNDSKNAPAGTPIRFKVCPKNHFDAQGVPDPAWTIDVTTKVYEK